jgi:hypothetical protein
MIDTNTQPTERQSKRLIGRIFPLILLLLGSGLLLYALFVLTQTLITFAQRNAFQQGTCTITASKLVEYNTPGQDSAGNPITVYNYYPHFKYIVHTANGDSYKASGYDGTDTPSPDPQSQQAVVSQYKIGSSYPCWYNSSNATQAYLVHYANIISPLRTMLILFPVSGFLLWIAIALLRR